MTPSGLPAARRQHASVTLRACHVTWAAAELPMLAARAVVRARRSCAVEKAVADGPESGVNAGVAE
eukprot:2975158-Pleurochrysis_carterae.AAC.1